MKSQLQPKPPIAPLYRQLATLRDTIDDWVEMDDDSSLELFDEVLRLGVELSCMQEELQIPEDILKFKDRLNEIEDFIVNNLGVE